MSKKKIKIRYIIFVLIIIGIVVFVGKITKLDDLNAEKVTEIILVSPPYKKRITDRQEIEEFTSLFNERKKKPVFSIINIITTETYQYDIIFCGENIAVNRQKYVMDESIDSELEQFYRFLNETEEKYN